MRDPVAGTCEVSTVDVGRVADYLIIMESRIRATDAARRFSDLLNRIHYRGEVFVIERGGEPICRMGPVGRVSRNLSDLHRFLGTIPGPDIEFWDDIEAGRSTDQGLPDSPWDS